jgi:multidrug efflux system outer membrane protein
MKTRLPVLIKVSTLSVLISTLTACAVGPDYIAPDQVKSIAIEQPYQQAETALNWWGKFNDPTLNHLIEVALSENRSLARASANVDRAYALFKDQANDTRPSGTLDTGYQAYENSTLDPADDDLISRGYQTGANLSWDIDLFGKLRRAKEAALANAEQADILWQDVQLSIISQVASSYGAYRGAELRLKVARQNVDNLHQSRDIVLARLDAGMASELELARMNAQLHEVEASIPGFESQLASAKSTLASLLATTSEELSLADESALPTLDSPVALVQSNNYLRFRADIASNERALAAATANIGVATADLYPNVSLRGFLGFLSSPGFTVNSTTESWSIAPTLSWQLADLGSVQARIQSSKASARMALAEFQQSVFDGLNEMTLSLKSYNLSRQQELITQKQRKASEKAVSVARQRYEAGSGEFLDLLDAERELLRSRDQLAVLEQQTFDRLVSIYQAFGGGITLIK